MRYQWKSGEKLPSRIWTIIIDPKHWYLPRFKREVEMQKPMRVTAHSLLFLCLCVRRTLIEKV